MRPDAHSDNGSPSTDYGTSSLSMQRSSMQSVSVVRLFTLFTIATTLNRLVHELGSVVWRLCGSKQDGDIITVGTTIH